MGPGKVMSEDTPDWQQSDRAQRIIDAGDLRFERFAATAQREHDGRTPKDTIAEFPVCRDVVGSACCGYEAGLSGKMAETVCPRRGGRAGARGGRGRRRGGRGGGGLE